MMGLRRAFVPLVSVFIVFIALQPLPAQTVITTLWTGTNPTAVAVNPATNLIYVLNVDDQNVTVIDGAMNRDVTWVPVGSDPHAIAVNPATNKIYVTNTGDSTVTVIDGSTNVPVTIPAGDEPWGIAIDSTRNRIYVTNDMGQGTVTAIDGATNLITTIPARSDPGNLVVNPVTNKIYVCNEGENTVTLIDGATLTNLGPILVGHEPTVIAINTVTNRIYVDNYDDATVSVIDGNLNQTIATLSFSTFPEALAVNQVTNRLYVATDDNNVSIYGGNNQLLGTIFTAHYPYAMLVNPVTNKIYVAASSNYLVTIDGVTNTTHTIQVGYGPEALAANLGTNRLYVVNNDDNTVSIVAGANASALQFKALAPCRLMDTRPQYGGHGAIQGGTSQNFVVPQLGNCQVPANAGAYALNVTVVPHGPLGYLSIWPTGEDQPIVSTMNSLDGRTKANAAIVPAGYQGGVSVFASNTSDVILDVNGYFVSPGAQTYQFYPLTPCRVIDTRNPVGHLGGPSLVGGVERDFPVLESSCLAQASNAQAYSFNFTVVPTPQKPHQALGYLSVWPEGESQPTVSTLNNMTATTVANAAIVPAGTSGTNGGIAVFPSNDTDLVVDVDGYFAAPASGGLSMYPVAPCRVLDTRGNGQPFVNEITVNVGGSPCAPPSSAKAYVFNATVVPQTRLGYLTLWPDGQQQPAVSTLNAVDGWITSNMAIVPTTNSSIDAFASNYTHLILDISGYFAP